MRKQRWMAAAVLAAAVMLYGCGAKPDTAGEAGKAAETAGPEAADQKEEASAEDGEGSGEAEAYALSELEAVPFEELFKSFHLKDLEGNEVTEEILSKADVTMLNFWATFCGPCLKEMPDLAAINREYQEAGKSFQIIGVVTDTIEVDGQQRLVTNRDIVDTAASLCEQIGADYVNLIPEGEFAFSMLYSGQFQAVPTTVFVDSEGTVIGNPVVGSRSKENWQAVIDGKLSGGEE